MDNKSCKKNKSFSEKEKTSPKNNIFDYAQNIGSCSKNTIISEEIKDIKLEALKINQINTY